MIKQVCTFHKDTYNLKSYKEYLEGKLIVHTEYDVNNNKIYFESNYGDEPRFWFRRKFASGCKNDTGHIVSYEDSNGEFKYVRYEGKRRISIVNEFSKKIKYDSSLVHYENIEINVTYDSIELFTLKASKEIDTDCYYAVSYVEKSNYFTLKYSSVRFDEIYYQDSTLNGNNRIIHVDEAHRITEYKDLMSEFNIIMCSKNYRPDSREFRKFIPIY
jgi:hypothetical protein